MKILKFKKIIPTIKKYRWKETAKSLKYLPRVFGKLEKILLLGLFVGVIGLLGLIGIIHWLSTTSKIPQTGGTFREGIVGETKDLDKHLSRLVNAGLTKSALQ